MPKLIDSVLDIAQELLSVRDRRKSRSNHLVGLTSPGSPPDPLSLAAEYADADKAVTAASLALEEAERALVLAEGARQAALEAHGRACREAVSLREAMERAGKELKALQAEEDALGAKLEALFAPPFPPQGVVHIVKDGLPLCGDIPNSLAGTIEATNCCKCRLAWGLKRGS